ncbi:MAG: DUF1385 domain-containing protein [Bacillota bacterium]
MENIKINGGRAFLNGVSIHSNVGYSKVIYKDGQYYIKSAPVSSDKNKGKIINFLNKIPFLRAFCLIYSIFKRNTKSILKITFIYIAIIILSFSFMSDNMVSKVNSNENFFLIFLLFLIFFIIKLLPISNYHGAEHMVINYYKENKDLNIVKLRNASRISRKCGSVLIMLTITVFLFLNIFIPSPDIAFILGFMIGYELFENDFKIFRPIVLLSGIIQKYLLTSKPNNQQLRAAVLALENSIKYK